MSKTEVEDPAAPEDLSLEDEQFLKKLEEQFKDRYTDKDEDFVAVFNQEKVEPPVIKVQEERRFQNCADQRYNQHKNGWRNSNNNNQGNNYRNNYQNQRHNNNNNNNNNNNRYNNTNHNSHINNNYRNNNNSQDRNNNRYNPY